MTDFYQGGRKVTATYYKVWIVRRDGTRTDHGIHPKVEAGQLAAQLIERNPLETVHCVPVGGAPMADKELDAVFERIAGSKARNG